MYYIQVIRGEVYIRKPSEDFDLVEYIEEEDYLAVEILKNQFEDKSLLLVYHPEIDWTEDKFITRDGHIVCGGFDIVGSSEDKYTLLTKDQVQEVLKELL